LSAPVGTNTTELPEQIVALLMASVGEALTVIVVTNVFVLGHPLEKPVSE
jgi:hypothetical protein